jgi:hypothetical protein
MRYDLVESTVQYIKVTNDKAPIEEERVQYFEVNDPLGNCKRIQQLKYGRDVSVDMIDGRLKVYYVPENDPSNFK